jgi:hypothetical protein
MKEKEMNANQYGDGPLQQLMLYDHLEAILYFSVSIGCLVV